MERFVMSKLLTWKKSSHRKPLVLKGVRQVGKTWILKEFGHRCYDNVAYFNFDEHAEYKQFFETTQDVLRLVRNLMLISSQKIEPEHTLIIFDEVQSCPQAVNVLKYFCENAPEYHVACAGSLLEVAPFQPASFTVGQVNFMQVNPMTFSEFLLANGDGNLLAYMESVDNFAPIPGIFFNQLVEKTKMYFVTGGLPEPVSQWTEARDVTAMQETLSDIISSYELDFAKHPHVSEYPKVSQIWKSIPVQLARENKKFVYKAVKEGARAREYEAALEWLVNTRLLHKIYRSSQPGLPLSAHDESAAYKVYLADVGLLRRLSQLAPSAFGEGKRLFTELSGALCENFVLQSLMNQLEVTPRYWSQNNPHREVNFVVQLHNEIVPVAVDLTQSAANSSLHKYRELFPAQTKLLVRFSLDNLRLDGQILNIPLFMADHAGRLMGKALEMMY